MIKVAKVCVLHTHIQVCVWLAGRQYSCCVSSDSILHLAHNIPTFFCVSPGLHSAGPHAVMPAQYLQLWVTTHVGLFDYNYAHSVHQFSHVASDTNASINIKVHTYTVMYDMKLTVQLYSLTCSSKYVLDHAVCQVTGSQLAKYISKVCC